MTGGSFTAKDVASLLEIASNYLLSFDQVKEFNAMLETATKRAYEMNEKKIKDLENRCESLEKELEKKEDEFSEYMDKAEELDNLENNIHPEIWEAVCGMLPGDRLTFAQAYECAEAIRNCGKFDASQLRMAI
jgi:predicted nuclease with TOPRIM domain